jgi:hypothetical protein
MNLLVINPEIPHRIAQGNYLGTNTRIVSMKRPILQAWPILANGSIEFLPPLFVNGVVNPRFSIRTFYGA